MTNTTAAATKTAVEPTPCLCSHYEIVVREFETPDGPDYDAESTGCVSTTGREFAPGHDAKLKALLIDAGVRGLQVRYNGGGSATLGAAENMAAGFAFSYMVINGIERGRAKAAAKAERKAAKADRPAKTRKAKAAAPAASTDGHVVAVVAETPAQEAPATVQIKVGRWEYSATIDEAGDAHYNTAKGDAAVAVKGVYKLA